MGGCDAGGCDVRGCDVGGCDVRGCDVGGCDVGGCDVMWEGVKGTVSIPVRKHDIYPSPLVSFP